MCDADSLSGIGWEREGGGERVCVTPTPLGVLLNKFSQFKILQNLEEGRHGRHWQTLPHLNTTSEPTTHEREARSIKQAHH